MASIPVAAPQGGDQNRAVQLLAVGWSECVVSIIIIALRFHSRTLVTGGFWYDDGFIFITLASMKLPVNENIAR